jgi:hypothetical protein
MNNQKRMDYANFRKQNYFIGSGSVESACKQIVSLRLKRAGARWTKTGASAVAKARAAWLSHQWDDLPWEVKLANYLNFARNSDTLLGQGEDKRKE